MSENSSRKYDLQFRTFIYAKAVRDYVYELPKHITNVEIGRQLIRAAGSVGANYIEADESLSKRDFIMRIKICKKEAKESRYWLKLSVPKTEEQVVKTHLIGESAQLIKIFAAILKNIKP